MKSLTAEPAEIRLTRYRDEDGQPTCAVDFDRGLVCRCYLTQRMGCHETCMFADKSGLYWRGMERRNDGKGTLIPLDNCPVWAGLEPPVSVTEATIADWDAVTGPGELT